jgi:hypothetical protein
MYFMTAFVPYINGGVTLLENAFNLLGYLPQDQFPRVNAWSTKWRRCFGCLQIIAGVALFAFGCLSDYLSRKPATQKYLTLAQQAMSLGILYFNHGTFNIIRSYIERRGWGVLTGAYDFYGRKFLPPLAKSFDLQGRAFALIRRQLDRIHFVTLFPPEFSLRA